MDRRWVFLAARSARLVLEFRPWPATLGADSAEDIELSLLGADEEWEDFGGDALLELWRCPREEGLARDVCTARALTKEAAQERWYGALACAVPLLDRIESELVIADDAS